MVHAVILLLGAMVSALIVAVFIEALIVLDELPCD